MNFALRRYCSVLGLSLIPCLVACGDDGVTCPDGMILVGGLCEVVADAAPRDGGEDDASVDGFLPDSGPPCEPMGDTDVPDADFVDANCDGNDMCGVVIGPDGGVIAGGDGSVSGGATSGTIAGGCAAGGSGGAPWASLLLLAFVLRRRR